MKPLTDLLAPIRERLENWESEHYYDRDDSWVPTDIATLLKVVEVQADALEFYAGLTEPNPRKVEGDWEGKWRRIPAAIGKRAREARAETRKLLEENNEG